MKRLDEQLVKGFKYAVKAAKQVVDQSESNIYKQINSCWGVIIVAWTVASLVYINRISSFMYAYAAATIFYILFIIVSIICLKDIRTYLSSPFKLDNIPVFIGHKLDIVFLYPFILMSLISIINTIIEISGIVPQGFQQAPGIKVTTAFLLMRLLMLPIISLSEELLNLINISLIYKHLKPLKQLRLPISIIAASALFGLLHSFAWGPEAVIPLAVAFIPVFFVTLYTGNVWISTLAHLYNDVVASVGMLGEGYSYNFLALLAIVPVAWAAASMIKACSRK